MQRRQFLTSSGIALAGVGLSPAFVKAAALGDRINIGVIGTGVRGQQLMTFLRGLPQFRVVAYCDILPFRLDAARAIAESSATAYTDHRRLLDDQNVDAVVIATHFSAHHEVVLDALDAGKHVYCEKTMIKGISETREVVDKARECHTQIFQTGFQYHSSPLYVAAANMIARGDIGAVAAVDCQWNRNGNWRRPVPDPKWERQVNWRMYREYSSGLVSELSAHQMDFCNRVLGSGVKQIQGVGGIDYWQDGRETYDNVHVVCRYRSGVTATFTSLTSNNLDNYRVAVLGQKASIILTTRRGWFIPEGETMVAPDGVDLVSGASVVNGPQSAYRSSDTGSAYQIEAPDDDPTPRALADFANAILDARQPASNVLTGATASIMVQMAIDAMDNGTVERWQPEYDLEY